MEERVGFEPTIPISQNNGFQDRRIRPLCHLSNRTNFNPAFAYPGLQARQATAGRFAFLMKYNHFKKLAVPGISEGNDWCA